MQDIVGPELFKDPRLNAKMPKIMPHLFTREPVTIWLDGNISTTFSEDAILRELDWNGLDADMLIFRHPYRTTLEEEINELVVTDKEDKKKLHAFAEWCDGNGFDLKKMRSYQHRGPQWHLPLTLAECGLIVRDSRHSVMEQFAWLWWSLICRFSARDQLTFPIAVAMLQSQRDLKVHYIDGDIRKHHLFRYHPIV